MEVIDFITINLGKESAVIELCLGDLTEMSPSEAVDLLVISACCDDYCPTAGSMIGALHRKGISMEELADHKAIDLRTYCSGWLSTDLVSPPPGIQFRRIFCFEPRVRSAESQMIEDLFRGLVPILNNSQTGYSIAMPLLASGGMGVPVVAMLSAILRTAIRWIKFGLPIRRLRIVERAPVKAQWMKNEFALAKKMLAAEFLQTAKKDRQAVSHVVRCAPEDRAFCDELVQGLQVLQRQKTIAVWHEGLALPGENLDAEIQRHIEQDDIILLLLSPNFLASDRCMEQAERAFRRHERHEVRLIPVLARPTSWMATPFGILPPLPTDGTPITSWPNRDQALANISGGIRLLSA